MKLSMQHKIMYLKKIIVLNSLLIIFDEICTIIGQSCPYRNEMCRYSWVVVQLLIHDDCMVISSYCFLVYNSTGYFIKTLRNLLKILSTMPWETMYIHVICFVLFAFLIPPLTGNITHSSPNLLISDFLQFILLQSTPSLSLHLSHL